MDWLFGDAHTEFHVFKTLTKVWLKDVRENKQYIFIFHLLRREGLLCYESFSSKNKEMEKPDKT